MQADSLEVAAALLDDAVKDRIRRLQTREGPPDPEFAKVILEIAALCGGLRCEWLGSEKLHFTLDNKESKEYTFPFPSHANGLLRSVLARFAFLVNDLLHAEVPDVSPELSAPELSNLSVEEQMRQVTDFVESVSRASIQRHSEIEAKGLPSTNPYGFSLTIDYTTSAGKKVPLYIETSNTLGKPFYFDVKKV